MSLSLTSSELPALLPFLTPQERAELDRLLTTGPRRRLFRGANARAQTLREEFILSGPSETGKTIACLTLLDTLAREHPGSQLAIVRKVRADMDGTVLLSWKNKIIAGRADVHPYGGESPQWYDYANGSRVWVGGLDNPGKTLSSERDAIYVNQAEELTLDDWETLTTRTTGRAGNAPYAFTFGDCNPRGSKHWILERAKARRLKLLVSRHLDNPNLYDEAGQLTPQGERSMAALGALTGLRSKRLKDGLWVQAEGAVYDTWDPAVHVRTRDLAEFPLILLAVDDGYTNPAALLWVGVDPDGRLHALAEWYERQKLHGEIAAAARDPRFGRLPGLVVCDAAAASLIAEMGRAGLNAIGHKGLVKDGIDLVQTLLKVQGDGRPRMTVDPGCVNFIREIEDYVWASGGKEAPVKEADHLMDACRYLVHYLYAPSEASAVSVGYGGD